LSELIGVEVNCHTNRSRVYYQRPERKRKNPVMTGTELRR
jgi:hypothetical protein